MHGPNTKLVLEKLVSLTLDERKKVITEDLNSKRDEYACIDPFDMANALEVAIGAVDGSGNLDWYLWQCYGYVYLTTDLHNLKKQYASDEMLYLLKDKIQPERLKFLEEKSSKLNVGEFIDLLSQEEHSTIFLTLALDKLYDPDFYCYQMATFDVNDDLRFEVTKNGEYSSIDGIKGPYDLRDDGHRYFFYWEESNFEKIDQIIDDEKLKYSPIREVWIEARKESGSVADFSKKLQWIKTNLGNDVSICLFRLFNEE